MVAFQRNALWATETRLLEDTVRKSPDKARMHVSPGWAYRDNIAMMKRSGNSIMASLLVPEMRRP
jgi:hypothetical protein